MSKFDCEENWALIKSGIYEILNGNTRCLSFVELNHKAYNMVNNSCGDILYDRLFEVISEHTKFKVLPDILRSLTSDKLLEALGNTWCHYHNALVNIKHILSHMERTYVQQRGVSNVCSLGNSIFTNIVVRCPDITENVRNELLQKIEMERNGDKKDCKQVRIICQMLIDLGRDVYVEVFEIYFLKESAVYFRHIRDELISNIKSPWQRRSIIESYMEEEIKMVERLLDPSTKHHIVRIVEEELLKNDLVTVTNDDADEPLLLEACNDIKKRFARSVAAKRSRGSLTPDCRE